jgi:biopolymer transport protein ExbD/biopolymer transport protein TolR
MAEINVTPMVDVMLVLLIIFMVAAPLMTSTIDIDLPLPAAASDSGQRRRDAVGQALAMCNSNRTLSRDTLISPTTLPDQGDPGPARRRAWYT